MVPDMSGPQSFRGRRVVITTKANDLLAIQTDENYGNAKTNRGKSKKRPTVHRTDNSWREVSLQLECQETWRLW